MTDLTAALAQAKTGPIGLSDEHEARAAAEEREIEAMAIAFFDSRVKDYIPRRAWVDVDRDGQGWYRQRAAAARAALDAVRAGAPDDPDVERNQALGEMRAIAERDRTRRDLEALIDEVRAWVTDDSEKTVVGAVTLTTSIPALLLICDAHDPRRPR